MWIHLVQGKFYRKSSYYFQSFFYFLDFKCLEQSGIPRLVSLEFGGKGGGGVEKLHLEL